MSVLISCQDLCKSYYARPLFESLNFTIHEGDRMGVIGPNGAGKSTLMRLLAGLEEPDDGIISRRRGLRVAYIAQAPEFNTDHTVWEVLKDTLKRTGLSDDECDAILPVTLGELGFKD